MADYTDEYSTGDRRAIITVTRSSPRGIYYIGLEPSNGDEIDGATGTGGGYLNPEVIGEWVKFEFDDARIVTAFRVYLNAAWEHYFKIEGSNNDSDWDELLGSTEILAGAPNECFVFSGNTTAYRYYKMTGTVDGTTTGGWLREFEFKIEPSVEAPTVTTQAANGIGFD